MAQRSPRLSLTSGQSVPGTGVLRHSVKMSFRLLSRSSLVRTSHTKKYPEILEKEDQTALYNYVTRYLQYNNELILAGRRHFLLFRPLVILLPEPVLFIKLRKDDILLFFISKYSLVSTDTKPPTSWTTSIAKMNLPTHLILGFQSWALILTPLDWTPPPSSLI